MNGWDCPVDGCGHTGIDAFADRCPNDHPRRVIPLADVPPTLDQDTGAAQPDHTRAPGTLLVRIRIDDLQITLPGPVIGVGRESPHAALAEYLKERYPNVSRDHLSIYPYPSHVTVADNASSNGTFTLDGTRLAAGEPHDSAHLPLRLRLARNCWMSVTVLTAGGAEVDP